MQPTTPAGGAQPKPAKTRNVPQGEQQLSEVLDLAVAEWGQRPQLTLEWTTQADAAKLAANLRASLRTSSSAADTVTPQARRLAELDRQIDGSKQDGKLKYVKKALALEYDEEDDGKPYYGEFGIQKIGSEYTLPHDRGERAEALLKLVKALPKHNLGKSKYGTAFWQPIADEYNKLQAQVAKDTGTRATAVGTKNQYREAAEDVLLALVFLLKANYPKTCAAERRKFGMLKESY